MCAKHAAFFGCESAFLDVYVRVQFDVLDFGSSSSSASSSFKSTSVSSFLFFFAPPDTIAYLVKRMTKIVTILVSQ